MKTGFRLITLMATALLALSANAFYMDARIIGGDDAVAGEVPWQVALYIGEGEDSSFCGGSIIDDRWVISAAHCFVGDDGEKLTGAQEVVSGVLKLSEATESDVVEVEEVHLHPEYVEQLPGFDHDIAILKLSQPLELDGLERQSIAWLTEDRENLESPGTAVTVSGWGVTEEESDPDHLQVVEIELIDCSETDYSSSTDNMLCATNEDYSKDSCSGDSGGPMAVQAESSDWYLAGIVSHGPFPCAEENKPGVYTRVTQYNAWIQEVTGLEPAEGAVIEDDDNGTPVGSGSGGSGGSSSSGSMANPATWLMLLLLGGLALSARWKKGNQPAGGRS